MRALTGVRLHQTTSAATAIVSTIASEGEPAAAGAGAVALHGHGGAATGSAAGASSACSIVSSSGSRGDGRLGSAAGSPSTISKRTTVMLSIPPARFAAATSASAAASGSLPAAAISSAICSSRTMSVSPSEQIR